MGNETESEQQPEVIDLQSLGLKWLKELDTIEASKEQKAFERIGERIVKKYRNSDAIQVYESNTGGSRVMFNTLWTVVQIMQPVLYARLPQVVVEREFKDKDPVGRVAAMGAERATSYMVRCQQDRFSYAVKSAVLDRLLCGRGQVWLTYDVKVENNVISPYSEIVRINPLNWLDYRESPARNQYEVRFRARRAYMTRDALVKRFGDIGKQVQLGDESDKRRKNDDEFVKQAEVWEIWDEENKMVVWVSKGYREGALDAKPDTLRLKDFYPCPIPLLATTVTDTTYPTPDFKIYEKLADEVDYVTKRIASIMDCVRLVGAAAAGINEDIKNMLKLQDGQLFPKENWARFAEQGGFKGSIDWLPVENAVTALQPLMQYQQHCLSLIFEQIIGLPDIIRGSSDPNETVEAQQQKGRWATIRVSDKQADVQRFCREIVSKMAEIIFEPGLFTDKTISLMAGVDQFSDEDKALWPEALALLRNDRLRTFRVDIETDSTIAANEEQDKAARTEFLGAVSGLFGQVQSVVQFSPDLMKPMLESALFAARAFRAGRSLEGAFEQAIDKILDQQNQPPPEPPPDYEMQRVQIEAQRLQQDGQIAMSQLQLENQKLGLDAQKIQVDSQTAQAKMQVEFQKLELEAQKIMSADQAKQFDAQLEQFKQQFTQMMEQQRLDLDKATLMLSEREKLMEEARLKQEQMLRAAEMIAAKQPASQQAPVINILNEDSEKEVEMSRDSTGKLRARTRKVKKGLDS